MPQRNQRLIGLVPLEGLARAALAPAVVGAPSLPLSVRVGTAEHSRAQYISQLQHRQHTVFVSLLAIASDLILPPRLLRSLSIINTLSTGLRMAQR